MTMLLDPGVATVKQTQESLGGGYEILHGLQSLTWGPCSLISGPTVSARSEYDSHEKNWIPASEFGGCFRDGARKRAMTVCT